MPKPTPDFTMGDLLAQLKETLGTTDVGYTTRELMEATGASQHLVRKQLRVWHREGILLRGLKQVEAIDGRLASVPAYRMRGEDSEED